jgi:hypothetical protein
MSTPSDSSRSLNEISHLFLSSVRERQMDGAPRPQRIPPGAPRMETSRSSHSIDLSPEEFSGEFPEPSMDLSHPEENEEPVKPLAITLGSHFGHDFRERVHAYARHLGRTAGRVGLIFADESAIHLSCFDKTEETGIEPETTADIDTFVSVLSELNCDVNRWLIATTNPRMIFDRPRTAILLASCDHEGVIEAYRTLKGLSTYCPEHVGVALFEARDLRDAQRVHRKLASVADQFLGCAIDLAAIVIPTTSTNRHPLATIPSNDAAWQRLAQFFATAPAARITPETTLEAEPKHVAEEVATIADHEEVAPRFDEAHRGQAERPNESAEPAPSMKIEAPAAVQEAAPVSSPLPLHPPVASVESVAISNDVSDVLDLPTGGADEDSILSAITRDTANAFIECPLRPPMLNMSRLVVDRQRRVTLLAVASEGLSDLQTIASAYRWLNENRALVSMAFPQMNIDAHALPQLRLLIDHHDASATTLQTLLQSGCVQLQTYRKLRWGNKTGLLLEAA